jgi:uncharacterized protein YecE (DUF72 family)
MLDVTADFVYVRLHGDQVIYASGYTSRALDTWAQRIRRWHRRGDVYVYFDNDVKVKAPFDALSLMDKLDLQWRPASPALRPRPAATRLGRISAGARLGW